MPLFLKRASMLLLGLSCARGAPGVVLESLDLASLLAAADLVVLLEGYEFEGADRPGTGTVRKVYKGEASAGTHLRVIPWRADLASGAGMPPAGRPGPITGVFFLRRQAEGASWWTVLSGIRIVRGEAVLSPIQQGGGPYTLSPARSESLDSRSAGRPLERRRLDDEMDEAKVRLGTIVDALALSPGDAALSLWRSLLDEEVRRVFGPGGPPSITRSDLVIALARKLAESGDIDVVWQLRERVPRDGMGAHVDVILARSATLSFLEKRLGSSDSVLEALEFLVANGFHVEDEVKRRLVGPLLALTATLPEDHRSRGHAAAAVLYRGTPLDEAASLVPGIIEVIRQGEASALFHLGGALAERQPALAHDVLPDRLRIFALVSVGPSDTRRLEGKVELRRFPSRLTIANPSFVLERLQPDGSTTHRRRLPAKVPRECLAPGREAKCSAPFELSFEKDPLLQGKWRIYLEVRIHGEEGRGSWRSGATTFQVSPGDRPR